METSSLAAAAGAPRQRLAFTYDYMGRRIVKAVESWNGSAYVPHHTLLFLYQGWNLAAEILASNGQKIRSYTWGADLSGSNQAGGVGGLLFIEQQPENKAYAIGYDGNGNVVGLFDMVGGSNAATYEYDPFGEPIIETGFYSSINPIRWSTKYSDFGSSLVYYGLRVFSEDLGRWISRDPLNEAGFDAVYSRTGPKMSLPEQQPPFLDYIFAKNNGISKFDKLGLAYFALRELGPTGPKFGEYRLWIHWTPGLSENDLLGLLNLELSHEHLFFEDGKRPSNIGFNSGNLIIDDKRQWRWRKVRPSYDDCIMRKAVARVGNPQPYNLVCNNCQTWADKVRAEYAKLLSKRKK